jgi:1-phosphofructokinase family hexose kinase
MSVLTVCLNPTIQKTLRFASVVPGEVNRTAEHRLDASGKGINVTRVLAQLEKKVTHLTQLGGVMRELFLSLCEQDSLNVEWVESESEIRFCYTMLTEKNVTEFVEESKPVGAGTEERLAEKFDFLINTGDFSCLVISGTKAAGFSDAIVPHMVQKAKEKGLKIILDIKGKDLTESLQYRPDVIKPNLSEFAQTFALDDTATRNELTVSKALDINMRYGCNVILTDGSNAIHSVEGNNVHEFEIQLVKPVNTTGCGDAFTAGLAAALTDGADFNAAIAEGIRCGALNAGLERPGVI